MRADLSHKPTENCRSLTTGQVARLLNVSPGAVARWIDDGKLKGYVVPPMRGKGAYAHRRVGRADLRRFMIDHDYPADLLAQLGVLSLTVVVCGPISGIADLEAALPGASLLACTNLYTLGVATMRHTPHGAIIDLSLGRSACQSAAVHMRTLLPDVRLVAIGTEDDGSHAVGFDFTSPPRPQWERVAGVLTGRNSNA